MPLWWWAGPPAFMSSTPPHECSPPMLVKASIWGYYCFLINLSTILILSLHLQHYVDQVFATPVRQEIRHILTRAPRWWCHHLLPPAQVAADAPSLYSPPHSSAFYKPLSASHLEPQSECDCKAGLPSGEGDTYIDKTKAKHQQRQKIFGSSLRFFCLTHPCSPKSTKKSFTRPDLISTTSALAQFASLAPLRRVPWQFLPQVNTGQRWYLPEFWMHPSNQPLLPVKQLHPHQDQIHSFPVSQIRDVYQGLSFSPSFNNLNPQSPRWSSIAPLKR